GRALPGKRCAAKAAGAERRPRQRRAEAQTGTEWGGVADGDTEWGAGEEVTEKWQRRGHHRGVPGERHTDVIDAIGHDRLADQAVDSGQDATDGVRRRGSGRRVGGRTRRVLQATERVVE